MTEKSDPAQQHRLDPPAAPMGVSAGLAGQGIEAVVSPISTRSAVGFHSQTPVLSVECDRERTYENTRRETFRPSPEQLRQARSWLVQVVARRAVEILQAQETAR